MDVNHVVITVFLLLCLFLGEGYTYHLRQLSIVPMQCTLGLRLASFNDIVKRTIFGSYSEEKFTLKQVASVILRSIWSSRSIKKLF